MVGSPCSPRDSQESSPTPQFKSIHSLALSFTVQLSHPYMTTGKTIALTRWTFVGKVMSLLFNMLSRLVTTFLPRSKRLLISRLQSPSAAMQRAIHVLSKCERSGSGFYTSSSKHCQEDDLPAKLTVGANFQSGHLQIA